jgi:hypothetical protein
VHVQRHTGTTKTSLSLQEICLLSSAFFHAHGRCFSFNGRVEPTEVKLSSVDLTWPMEEPTLNPNRNIATQPPTRQLTRSHALKTRSRVTARHCRRLQPTTTACRSRWPLAKAVPEGQCRRSSSPHHVATLSSGCLGLLVDALPAWFTRCPSPHLLLLAGPTAS